MIRRLGYLLVFLTVILFVLYYFRIALPYGQPTISHTLTPDGEADYLITLSVFRGEGLYSNFSIVYPPGRFFFQSLLFSFFGSSAPVIGVSRIAFTYVIFPVALFILSYFFFKSIFSDKNKNPLLLIIASYAGTFITTSLYLTFIRSAQEVHVTAAIFFSALFLPDKLKNIKAVILGLFLGLVFLFRIDVGIILSTASALAFITLAPKDKKAFIKLSKYYLAGFLLIWIPTLILILVKGSIFNFLYDTLILGLIVQPKFMGLAIPQNLKFIWQASLMLLFSFGGALFIEGLNSGKKQFVMKVIGLAVVLSYVPALGRSDEPHLWFGLIWLPLMIVYAFYRLIVAILKKESFSWKEVVIWGIIIFLYGWLMIQLKLPLIFLITTVLFFIIFYLKKPRVLSIIIGGLISSLIVFHSLAFLRLRFYFPRPTAIQGSQMDWITAEDQEFAGFKVLPESKSVLRKIRADIPKTEKYLLIFPENVLLNEYFKIKSPTRYILMTEERTQKTENDILSDIEKTQTKYFLIFNKSAKVRAWPVWDWILKNTKVIKKYKLGGDDVTLRIRK